MHRAWISVAAIAVAGGAASGQVWERVRGPASARPVPGSAWIAKGQRVGSNGIVVGFDRWGGPVVGSTDGEPPPVAYYPVPPAAFAGLAFRVRRPSGPWAPGDGQPSSQPVASAYPADLDPCGGVQPGSARSVIGGAGTCTGGHGHAAVGNAETAILVNVVDAPRNAWDYLSAYPGARVLTFGASGEVVVPAVPGVGAVVRARAGTHWTVEVVDPDPDPSESNLTGLELLAAEEERWLVARG